MASFATIISLLLFTTPLISSFPLDSICKQSKNPNFCYNLLKPHATANLQELDRFVIDATTARASKISSYIRSILSQERDPKLSVVYSLCSNYYSAALSALEAAKDQLRLDDYPGVKAAADTVSRDGGACRETFALAPGQPIAIAGDNNEFELLGNVFVVVSGKL